MRWLSPFPRLAVSTIALGLLSACEPSETPTGTEAQTASKASAVDETAESGIRLDFMDTSVSPGEDFFRYANGKWLSTTEIPPDKSRYGAFTMLADQAREDVREIIENAGDSSGASNAGSEAQQIGSFYGSFMDTATVEERGLAPIQPYFKEIDELKDHKALAPYFASASKRGVRSPLGFYIDTDEKKPDQYTVYLGHSGLSLPDRDYYLKDDPDSKALLQDFKTHVRTMFGLANLKNGETAAADVLAIESEIAKRHWPRTELRDREKTYNRYEREQLIDQGKVMDWAAYLDSADLEEADYLIIAAPSYFDELDSLLQAFTMDQWRNYVRWHTLSGYASLLPKAIDEEDFRFFGTRLTGAEQQEERWKRATNLTNSLLGDAVGKLYVEKHFSPEAKKRMEELVENLREAYRQSILELDWMSEETKPKAIEKLEKFRPKIGYPDKWRDLSELEVKADDLFGNYVRATSFHSEYETDKLGEPVDRDEWFMHPQTVNAYYNPGMNEIVFPAAILQPPFFNMEADDAVNYGAIGAVIGHEMGHGFDDQGAKSDGDGMLTNWWTEQDLREFQSRTQKLVEQYNGYTVLDGVNINGSLTQGENIGDLGGLTIAYKAYQLALDGEPAPEIDGLTGDQRFFLGWAQVWANKYRDEELRRRILTDPHSPPRFRTNGVLRNMPAFYQAFGVKEGDWMYLPPEERVKIW